MRKITKFQIKEEKVKKLNALYKQIASFETTVEQMRTPDRHDTSRLEFPEPMSDDLKVESPYKHWGGGEGDVEGYRSEGSRIVFTLNQ